MIDGEGEFDSMYLNNIDDDENPGVVRNDKESNTPSEEDYGDMHTNQRPEDDDEEAIDNYLNVELIMNMSTNDEQHGHVIKRTRGLDGKPIGCAHANPLFETPVSMKSNLQVEHMRYQVNIIAENMYAQVDSEGNQYLLLQEITDHQSDNSAIPILEGTVCSANGLQKPKKTMRRWFLLVQWRDGSVSWEKLVDLKASNPVEVAEYAVANRLVKEPAFKW
jgi:hypothetical protein